jgi:hypothetical protein
LSSCLDPIALELELTLAAYGLVESEFPSNTLGTRHCTDAAIPIPFTIDVHLAAFADTEDAASVSIVALHGVKQFARVLYVVDS